MVCLRAHFTLQCELQCEALHPHLFKDQLNIPCPILALPQASPWPVQGVISFNDPLKPKKEIIHFLKR